MNLLVATAPWPILVRIVSTRPGPWAIWGDVPSAVLEYLASHQHRVVQAPLPKPVHRHALPEEIASTRWQSIVVPALGHPLPTRWPIVRHLAALGAPVIVSDGTSWQWIHYDDVPERDAYTWALDRLAEPAAPAAAAPEVDLACVRADFLGDVFLAWPGIEAAARQRRTTLVTSARVASWIQPLAPSTLQVRRLAVDEWAGEPTLPSAAEVVDLSPPRATSPLTPALAHATAAARRAALTDRRASLSLAEMVAETLDVRLLPERAPARRNDSRMGLLLPSGSSGERDLDPATWATLARIAADALGVDRWTILGAPRDRAEAIVQAVRNARLAPFPLPPAAVVGLVDSACAALGVSSALAHLAALRHTPSIVIEHPTKAPFVHQIPGEHVHYVRPSSPWWRAHPDAIDVARAAIAGGDTYGFWPEELETSVAAAAARLGTPVVRGT